MAELRRTAGEDAGFAQGVGTGQAAIHQHVRATVFALDVAGVAHVLDVAHHGLGDFFDGDAGGGKAGGIHGHRQLSPGTAAGERFADAGHGGKTRHQQLVRDFVQSGGLAAAGFPIGTEQVDVHGETAHGGSARLRGRDPYRSRATRLFALYRGGDAAQFQFAHLDVAAGLETHPILAAGAANAAAGLRHVGHRRNPRFQRHQHFPLHHFGLGAPTPEAHVQGIALNGRHQFHGDALQGNQAQQGEG